MYRFDLVGLAILLASAGLAPAQEIVDQQLISKIKMEGFQNSLVMETCWYLTDVYGPRLSGTPNLKAAGEWSRKRLTEWGLVNAQLEAYGRFGPGWSVKKLSVEMTAPQYANLIAYPKAWTPSTKGALSGSPTIVDIRSSEDFAKYRGKLKGAIVMNGRVDKPNPHFQADAKRFSEDELNTIARATNPGPPKSYAEVLRDRLSRRITLGQITVFLANEGIAALLEPSERDHGVVRVTRQSYNPNVEAGFPAFVVAREHYSRITRLVDRKIPVRLEINLQTQIHSDDTDGYNVIAEIAGTDPKLKAEIVMLGGHLDSWHSGTGATDNAAGCAVMMEAVRILKAIGARPRRTIRIALWGDEEQGHLGSIGYMKKHMGNPEKGELLPEGERVSAYFNIDNGSGRIRGVYLQGNEAVRPIFEEYLKPFHYLGAATLTIENTGGTDHQSFDAVGIPGFQFIQDPIEYDTRTHHTNLDVYEALVEEDLKQAAVIVASFVYHTAMRDEKLPRKPPPKTS